MKNKILAAALASAGGAALLLASLTAFAATPTLYGAATASGTGVMLDSNSSSTPAYGGIDFGAPAASTTLSQLGSLMANYTVTAGDCGGGSPRYQITVNTGSTTANIFDYFGPSPNYTGCSLNTATSTGELSGMGSSTVDTSQLPGGTFYDTWSHALSAYGAYPVTDISLVTDGGWAVTGGMQDVLVPSATVNGNAYDLTTLATSTATTTASTTLMAPTGLTPNGTTLTSDQWTSANWNAVSASSTPVTYQYESSTASTTNADGSFTTPAYQSGWLSTNSISTAGTSPGTYWWSVRAMDNSGNMSPWSMPAMVTVTSASSTPSCDLTTLVSDLQTLLTQFPDFGTQIQAVINNISGGTCTGTGTGTGTSTPPTSGNGTIDQNGMSINAGGTIDFVGRNFNHEENITVTLNGQTLGTAHADGGGNFSTGSIGVPSTPGTYTYTFTGATGDSATATITVT